MSLDGYGLSPVHGAPPTLSLVGGVGGGLIAPAATGSAAPAAVPTDSAHQQLIVQLQALIVALTNILRLPGASTAHGGGGALAQGPLQSPLQTPLQTPLQAAGQAGAGAVALAPAPPATTPIPVTTTPASTVPGASTPAAAGVALVSPRPGDHELLQPVLASLRGSQTGQALLSTWATGRPLQVQLVDPLELAVRSPGALAAFSHATNTVLLSRAAITQDPTLAAVHLAHEATHWLHDDLLDAAGFSQLPTGPQKTGVSLATETEAYMIQARVARELGRATADAPATRPDGAYATFAETWQQLAATREYNPSGLQLTPSWYQRLIPGT